MDSEEESQISESIEVSNVDVKVDLDADYFQWKEGKEIEKDKKAYTVYIISLAAVLLRFFRFFGFVGRRKGHLPSDNDG